MCLGDLYINRRLLHELVWYEHDIQYVHIL